MSTTSLSRILIKLPMDCTDRVWCLVPFTYNFISISYYGAGITGSCTYCTLVAESLRQTGFTANTCIYYKTYKQDINMANPFLVPHTCSFQFSSNSRTFWKSSILVSNYRRLSIAFAGSNIIRIEEGGWWKISSTPIRRGGSDLYFCVGVPNFTIHGYLYHCRKAFSQESRVLL